MNQERAAIVIVVLVMNVVGLWTAVIGGFAILGGK